MEPKGSRSKVALAIGVAVFLGIILGCDLLDWLILDYQQPLKVVDVPPAERVTATTLFRDPLCKRPLASWAASGQQLESPMFVFGRSDHVFIRLDLGTPGLTVIANIESETSNSKSESVSIGLTEVTSGVYCNVPEVFPLGLVGDYYGYASNKVLGLGTYTTPLTGPTEYLGDAPVYRVQVIDVNAG